LKRTIATLEDSMSKTHMFIENLNWLADADQTLIWLEADTGIVSDGHCRRERKILLPMARALYRQEGVSCESRLQLARVAYGLGRQARPMEDKVGLLRAANWLRLSIWLARRAMNKEVEYEVI
jgi:hypothetical protein